MKQYIFEVHGYTKLFSKHFVRLWAFYRLKSSSYLDSAQKEMFGLCLDTLRYVLTSYEQEICVGFHNNIL